MARIFVRERGNVDEGEGRPRFAVVGVEGTDMKFFKTHLRKGELDKIAELTSAELVMLPRARHAFNVEFEEESNSAVLEFVRRHSGAAMQR